MITKQHLTIAAAIVVGLVWLRGTRTVDAAKQLRETVPLAGGDFVGDTWARLNAADLVAQGYPNLGGGPNADPGRIGVARLGLEPSWNGTLH